MNRAVRMIDFYQELYAVAAVTLCGAQHCEAALDLESGIVYRPHDDYPDGDILMATLPGGAIYEVPASKVTDHLLQRHARAEALLDGGEPNHAYQGVCEEMGRLVG